ncbi:MAG: cbb3-type cytochrome c oxidase N-terminal domain-containing protein [Chitinophagaceae bacterium]
MFSLFNKRINYRIVLAAVFLVAGIQPALAADGPSDSIFSNPLALGMLAVMALLAIVIGVLGYVLLGVADIRLQEHKKNKEAGNVIPTVLLVLCLTMAPSLFAQEGTAETVATATTSIAGLDTTSFYLMNGVILLEFMVIMVLLVNIRILIRKEQAKLLEAGLSVEEARELKKSKLNWWDKMNRMKPMNQEADIVLHHEYDGIRELDNRLPPWWLYGFYMTIIFAVIYLWRFHVSHTAPSSGEEYLAAVTKADMEIREYLKKKGDAVDENTVTLLMSADDLSEGRSIFQKSCASCHKESGGGDVGPNLTDDFWMHGNDIKSVFKTIRYGVNAMPQWQNQYSNKQIAQVASYVKSLHGTNPPAPKPPQGVEMKEEAVVDSTQAVVTKD